MEFIHYLLRSAILLTRFYCDRNAMLVRATDEFNIPATHPEIPHIYICWYVYPGKVSYMYSPVCIGKGCCYKVSFVALFHCVYSVKYLGAKIRFYIVSLFSSLESIFLTVSRVFMWPISSACFSSSSEGILFSSFHISWYAMDVILALYTIIAFGTAIESTFSSGISEAINCLIL